MKLFKRVMTMSASASSTTVDTWMVRRVIINNTISSESISSTNIILRPDFNNPVTTVISTCSSYSSSSTPSGLKLGVFYYLRRRTYNGNLINTIAGKHYTSTDAKSTTLYPNYIYHNDYASAEYSIDNPYVISCYISGETIFETLN